MPLTKNRLRSPLTARNYQLLIFKNRPLVQSQDPAETRPTDPIFENWSSKAQSPKLNIDETFLWLAQNILVQQLNHTRPHTSVLPSNTFVVLIRLSTTTLNLLTFNTSEINHQITRKNSAYWQIHTSGLFFYTRLIQVPGCTATRSADQLIDPVFTPEKNNVKLARVKGSPAIFLSPNSFDS